MNKIQSLRTISANLEVSMDNLRYALRKAGIRPTIQIGHYGGYTDEQLPAIKAALSAIRRWRRK